MQLKNNDVNLICKSSTPFIEYMLVINKTGKQTSLLNSSSLISSMHTSISLKMSEFKRLQFKKSNNKELYEQITDISSWNLSLQKGERRRTIFCSFVYQIMEQITLRTSQERFCFMLKLITNYLSWLGAIGSSWTVWTKREKKKLK